MNGQSACHTDITGVITYQSHLVNRNKPTSRKTKTIFESGFIFNSVTSRKVHGWGRRREGYTVDKLALSDGSLQQFNWHVQYSFCLDGKAPIRYNRHIQSEWTILIRFKKTTCLCNVKRTPCDETFSILSLLTI